MRVTLEANRSLLYASGIWVDKKEKLEELVEKLKLEKQPFADVNEKLKEALRVVGLLTPISKYILSESANKITYDALQIHGGTGYMKEFMVERLVRDARITNIYEGTSQLQIVAAAGGVINDVLAEYFNAWEAQEYKGSLSHLLNVLIEIRSLFYESLKYVKEKQDVSLQEVASKDLVELYTYIYVGYLLLNEANEDQRKVFTARRYILDALANARKNAEAIKSELYSDILHADTILI